MEDRLSELLEDYRARRAAGEEVSPGEYRDRAGEIYLELLDLLAAESALDVALGLEENAPLPRGFGAYTLLRELGRGAAGVVYEALHRELGRSVALKVLRPGFDTTPDALERFRREAVACAQVRHDHVVEVYEASAVDGRPYYAMTLLEGRSLSEIEKTGLLPEPHELCRQLAGVADALDTLHRRGIVHRDVKPGNIMVEGNGRMVLADFGLARSMTGQALTQTGEVLGTPLYMSPEQFLGQRSAIDGRTDVYALGASLYHLLSGRPLFVAQDLTEMIRMIMQDRPRRLRDLRPDIPEALERIVMKAVERRPEDRYGSAAALRDDLLAFAAGATVAGRPVSGTVHTLRRVRRMWLPLAAAAAVAAGAGIWWTHRPALLEVACVPDARVLLDGEPQGRTPWNGRLPPGSYELTLRSEGFLDRVESVRLGSGSEKSIERILVAADADDFDAARRLGSAFQLSLMDVRPFSGHRAGASMDVLPLYPRGAMRAQDLSDYRIDVGAQFFAEGKLRFRSGDTVLFEEEFDPAMTGPFVAPLPDAVRAALDEGSAVEWGFWPADGGDPITARFEVVADDASAVLARIDEELKEQPERVRRVLRAQALADRGLAWPAYAELGPVLAEAPENRAAVGLEQQLLEQLDLQEVRRLDGASAYTPMMLGFIRRHAELGR